MARPHRRHDHGDDQRRLEPVEKVSRVRTAVDRRAVHRGDDREHECPPNWKEVCTMPLASPCSLGAMPLVAAMFSGP